MLDSCAWPADSSRAADADSAGIERFARDAAERCGETRGLGRRQLFEQHAQRRLRVGELRRSGLQGTAASRTAAPGALRVMPLGDSITEGANDAATYRYFLQKDLERDGIAIDFVGSKHGVFRGKPRHADFDQDHEGHWGWTTEEVRAQIDAWAAAARPEVVLLHLGTNDFGDDPGVTPGNLSAIIDALRKANPDVVVFLARIIPAAGLPRDRFAAANDAIEAMGKAKSTDRSPVVIVAQDDGFDPSADTYDGTHPNEVGEKKMAAKWTEAIRAWRSSRRG